MTKKICPACGAEDIIKRKTPHLINEAFGGGREVDIVEDRCKVCGTVGDFFSQNDALISEAIDQCKSLAVKNILQDFLCHAATSMSSMERALELPQRTLTKWKNGQTKPSAAGLALLKMLRIFPWLLDVAENKFDYEKGQRIHINEAMRELVSHMSFDDILSSDLKISTSYNFVFNLTYDDPFQKEHNEHVPQEAIEGLSGATTMLVKQY